LSVVGRVLFSMMLQPSSPRRSGEFSTHLDINCAPARLAETNEIGSIAILKSRTRVLIAPSFRLELVAI
jgi:hypothetical protein